MQPSSMQPSDWHFVRKVLIVMVAAAIGYALFRLSHVLMLVFAAILLAVLLCALRDLIHRWTRAPQPLALAIAVLFCTAVVAGFLYLFGVQLVAQVQQVAMLLPGAIDSLAARLGMEWRLDQWDWQQALSYFEGLGVGSALGYGTTLAGLVADVTIVLASAVFLAVNPGLYLRGASLLFPRSRRALFVQTMKETGQALRLWLGGQLLVMLGVALLSWAAYAAIGLPSSGALALIAGLADFVPFVGPILGAIPALVMAATQSMQALLITLGAVVVNQQLESYVMMPLVQKHAVKMPPFLGVISIVVFGTLFGVMGVLLAVPLAVAIMVLVQRLWVNTALDNDIEVIGQESEEA